MMKEPSFTVGIEEEYMLVDPESRDLIAEAPATFMPACERRLAAQVTPEFLQCQVEVGTRVCGSIKDARDNLAELRHTVAEVARDHDLALVAASTHPFAQGIHQEHTRKERYDALAKDLQGVVRRLMISGMHVHVGIDEDDLRIDLMNQVTYVLPHFLALTTSSPFWKGHDTGLKSYRISVWDELPRTGLPERFESFAEYRRHVEVLVNAGIVEDATKMWWDVRPSQKFPTLEMRIADICTRMDDGICVAAMYQCWLRMLYRLRRDNKRWREYAPMLVNENRWRAHRYGIDEGLIDFGEGKIVPYDQLLEEMIVLTREDAEFFDCVAEVEHGRTILANGTSAHRQLRAFKRARADGADEQQALIGVVDQLIAETVEGL